MISNIQPQQPGTPNYNLGFQNLQEKTQIQTEDTSNKSNNVGPNIVKGLGILLMSGGTITFLATMFCSNSLDTQKATMALGACYLGLFTLGVGFFSEIREGKFKFFMEVLDLGHTLFTGNSRPPFNNTSPLSPATKN